MKLLVNPENLQTFAKVTSDYTEYVAASASLPSELSDCDWGISTLPKNHLENWPPSFDEFLTSASKNWKNFISENPTLPSRYLRAVWVLLLRSLCGLRGIKPSQLLGDDDENPMFIELDEPATTIWNNAHSLSINNMSLFRNKSLLTRSRSIDKVDMVQIRLEFVLQCFRRLDSSWLSVVYQLGEAWKLPSDSIKLSHMTTLLEKGTVDEQVEELMSQVQ